MDLFARDDSQGIKKLNQQLQKSGIDTDHWGTGKSKTLDNLQTELESGESILETSETGRLLRKVTLVGAEIYYVSPDGKAYRLVEDRQVFKNGWVRRRTDKPALTEKMKPDEDPKAAVIRGLQEELGIYDKVNLKETGVSEMTRVSSSYPGLHSQYVRHNFQIVFTDEQFKPGGYIEKQRDKTTYFAWKEIKQDEKSAIASILSLLRNVQSHDR